MYDVVLLAHHFGTSRLAALYRLRNLGYLTEAELSHLRDQEESGVGKAMEHFLSLSTMESDSAQNAFRHRFLSLGLEALRREEITRSKLAELAQLVGVMPDELARLLAGVALDDHQTTGDTLSNLRSQ